MTYWLVNKDEKLKRNIWESRGVMLSRICQALLRVFTRFGEFLCQNISLNKSQGNKKDIEIYVERLTWVPLRWLIFNIGNIIGSVVYYCYSSIPDLSGAKGGRSHNLVVNKTVIGKQIEWTELHHNNTEIEILNTKFINFHISYQIGKKNEMIYMLYLLCVTGSKLFKHLRMKP